MAVANHQWNHRIFATNTWYKYWLGLLKGKINWKGRIKVRGYSAEAPRLCKIYCFFFLRGKRRCLSRWRQGENNSVRWLRLAFLEWYNIKNFSRVHMCTICMSSWQDCKLGPCQEYPRRWCRGCWSPSGPKYTRPAQYSRVFPGGD